MNIVNNALKMVTPDQLDRRTVLKGITLGAGAVVLQPFLQRLAAEPAGQAPPKRFIFFMQGNGLWPHHVQPRNLQAPPRGTNRLIDRNLADLELPEQIAPLTPFKNRMAIIQKLSHKISGPGDHGKHYGALGCFNWRRGAASQTIDHALGAAQPSIIPVVGLGINPGAVFINSLSASAARRPTPIVCQPDLAFQMLFGSAAEGSAGRAFQARNRLLDWARSDIRRVRSELPAMDREQLDIYLDTFEQMRARQDRINENRERIRANLPSLDRFDSRRLTQRFEAQCAIAASAITSGLTNVVTIDASGYYTWTDLGITLDDHSIGHMAGRPEREPHALPIRRFHAERVADLARRLDAVREGNGTMLDNTLIIWMSDSGEEHHGFCSEWPLVLIGGLAGRLRTAGRFLQYPNYETAGNRTIANFYLSLLHAVGDRRERFGERDPNMNEAEQNGPLAEIMA
ncbi:MAG: DUF1552 domain-containing protein [Gemmataceae bacterium]|nr:DUF1552 domain-containing protein [Gemmataceae bacterium]